MKKREYIIKKVEQFDENGKPFAPYFYIVEKIWILGFIPYTREVKSLISSLYESVRILRTFETLVEAQYYIHNFLLSDKPKNTVIETTIDVIKYEKET